MIGFVFGQNLRTGSEIQNYFDFWHYFYPLLIFGGTNCLLICSFLFFISFTTKKKLLVVVGGLFLYVLYMIILIFSNLPFMSGSLPQSLETQQLSALIDPFWIVQIKPLELFFEILLRITSNYINVDGKTFGALHQ